MNIIGNFHNSKITITNIMTEHEEKYHLSFDIIIKANNLYYTYHFREVVHFNLFDFVERKNTRLRDECNLENYLELTKEYLCLHTNQNGLIIDVRISLAPLSAKEEMEKLLTDFKAICEVILEK